MKLLPRWHTPDSVARRLIDGLERGELTLPNASLDTAAMIEEYRSLIEAINSELKSIEVEFTPINVPSHGALVEYERRYPGRINLLLLNSHSLYDDAIRLKLNLQKIYRYHRRMYFFGFICGLGLSGIFHLVIVFLFFNEPILVAAIMSVNMVVTYLYSRNTLVKVQSRWNSFTQQVSKVLNEFASLRSMNAKVQLG